MSLASRSCLPKPISTDVREPGYREDLAYIHDSGFTDFVLDAAPDCSKFCVPMVWTAGSFSIWSAAAAAQ
jgi:hypothetical protein